MAAQNALPLQWMPSHKLHDFIAAPNNQHAFDAVQEPQAWPSAVAVIIGPQAGGKTHLAEIYREKHHAFVVADAIACNAALEQNHPYLVIDDADKIFTMPEAQEKLFFLFNSVTAKQARLLLTMTQAPVEWVSLPDLASRLKSSFTCTIEEPDDAMLKTACQKLFMDRGIVLDDQTLTYLIYRAERHFAFMRRLVEKLDTRALADNRRLTRPYLAEVLPDILQTI